ncbi:unnamed protein product [Zymoseptoria tritici ST99CH_1A5]|uniref:Rhodanese domain-containing protein n=2 Tax=Zymoseptoria tritici TaxID=1047171 RepID=A0A2H1GZ86_ZYMTR|nr:unnamed protein product [Zymoseptoria tritici ST99CH_1E4]SMY28093.1 unnamed protein product [Zymoseptoria tritici ST99CH_1A5]
MALPRSAAAAFVRTSFRTPQRLASSSQSLTRAISRPQFIARTRQPTFTATRSLTNSSSSDSKLYDFQQIQKLSSSPSKEKVLIDVREPSEYTAGYIPTAINLPIKSQPDALFLPAEEFLDRFGFEKPQAEQEVVFYCRSGVRSQAAASLARQVGYKQVSEYRGSWMDWEKNGGQGAKP